MPQLAPDRDRIGCSDPDAQHRIGCWRMDARPYRYVEENLSAANLVPQPTCLGTLLHDNVNFTNAHGVDHPSQPNYLTLFSGDTQVAPSAQPGQL
jgi:hypothetical protein